jgi:hypothetical protein
LLILLAAASCSPYFIRGSVTDASGQPLPGVAVKLEDGAEAVTNAVGEFKMAGHQGLCSLSFLKTGFTRGRCAAEVSLPGATAMPAVSLWKLPDSSGLFFLENNLYRKADPMEPGAYTADGKTVLHALRPGAVARTSDPMPRLICFQVPQIDAELCRLSTAQAAPTDAPGTQKDIWVRDDLVEMQLSPIDEPERLLWELRLFEPLQPGVYCMHWGALRGHKEQDPRAYVFEVVSPEADAAGK